MGIKNFPVGGSMSLTPPPPPPPPPLLEKYILFALPAGPLPAELKFRENTVCTRYMKSLCSESQNNKANTGSECH